MAIIDPGIGGFVGAGDGPMFARWMGFGALFPFACGHTGLPVWRPLFFADPADPDLRDVDNAFIIGRDLLVVANTGRGEPVAGPLPRGDWRDITEAVYGVADHPDLPQLLLHDGAVLPLGPVVQNLSEGLPEDLTALVNPDEQGQAEGWVYEDDGLSFEFREGGFRLNRWVYDPATQTVRDIKSEGQWPLQKRPLPLVVFEN